MIAYFDLDDTLCRYSQALLVELNGLRGEDEHIIDVVPEQMYARKRAIMSKESFWTNLKLNQEVKNLYESIKYLGFKTHILTAGPIRYPEAWSGKKKWADQHFPNVDLTITRDKSLLMGDILVDDYPKYFKGWLKSNPNGMVIAPYNGYKIKEPRTCVLESYNKDWPRIEKIIRRRFGNKLLH